MAVVSLNLSMQQKLHLFFSFFFFTFFSMKFACSCSGINDSVVGPSPLDYRAAESQVFELVWFNLSYFEDRVHLVSKKSRHSLRVSQLEKKQLLNEEINIPSIVM